MVLSETLPAADKGKTRFASITLEFFKKKSGFPARTRGKAKMRKAGTTGRSIKEL